MPAVNSLVVTIPIGVEPGNWQGNGDWQAFGLLPALSSMIEDVPVAIPYNPLSTARQFLLPSVTVTFPCGVADLALAVRPLTCTRTATSRPATG